MHVWFLFSVIASYCPVNYYTSLFDEIHAITTTHIYSLLMIENAVFLAYLG